MQPTTMNPRHFNALVPSLQRETRAAAACALRGDMPRLDRTP